MVEPFGQTDRFDSPEGYKHFVDGVGFYFDKDAPSELTSASAIEETSGAIPEALAEDFRCGLAEWRRALLGQAVMIKIDGVNLATQQVAWSDTRSCDPDTTLEEALKAYGGIESAYYRAGFDNRVSIASPTEISKQMVLLLSRLSRL